MKKALVHICCADCGLKLIEALKDYEVTFYFYNPNIHPESEWKARKEAVKHVFEGKRQKLVMSNWTPKDYFEVIKKPLGRCALCWRLRLTNTFNYAATNVYDTVSSTLFTSMYHDQKILRSIAVDLGKQYGVEVFLPESVDHCMKTSGFYKQNYCGCLYSLMEKYREKYI